MSAWDQEGSDVLSSQADRKEALLPPAHPSSGKGQALVCSGSDMPCRSRCRPTAPHGQALHCKVTKQIIQVQNTESLWFQNEHLLVYMRRWLHVLPHFILTAFSPLPRFREVCDTPKVTQLLGGRAGG